MMRQYFKSKYFALGVYFLFIQILIIIVNISINEVSGLFWFCNNAPFFIAIGFFLKKTQLIKGIISVGLIGQLGWIIDYLAQILFHTTLFGVTSYTSQISGWILGATVLIHVFSLTIAILFTYTEKIQKESLYYSIIYGTLLILLTVQLTPPELNINCLYRVCGASNEIIKLNIVKLIILGGFIMIMPGYLIQKQLEKIKKVTTTK
jgi:hypothetical protein